VAILDPATNVTIATNAGNWNNDVAANGDVVYWTSGAWYPETGYNIFRARGGVTTQLTFDPVSTRWNLDPLTDGTTAVYMKCAASASVPPPCDIVLNDGNAETILSPGQSVKPIRGSDYAITAGWAAYTMGDLAGTRQVWRHTGTGNQQLTFFGSTNSIIEGVSSDGTVLLLHGSRRYRAVPGAALEDLSSSLGRTINKGGTLYVIIGNTVFRVLP
jgi:hypothetical protein